MLPRSSLVFAVTCAVVFACPAHADPLKPTAHQVEFFERGRSAERTVLMWERPDLCAPVLLRKRCQTDLGSLIESSRPMPDSQTSMYGGLRVYLHTGDTSGIAPGFREANFLVVPEPMRQRDAIGAWAFEAGMVSVDVPAALGNPVIELLGLGHPLSLAAHVADAGAMAPLVPPDVVADAKTTLPTTLPQKAVGLSMDRLLAYDAELIDGFGRSFPTHEFPTVTWTEGALGDARLGVAVTTLQEMLDDPLLLMQSDSQLFVDDVFRHLADYEDDARYKTGLAKIREQLRPSKHLDQRALVKAGNTELLQYIGSIPQARLRAMVLGSLSAQVAFNAIVYKDSDIDAQFRNQLVGMDMLDRAVPGLRDKRLALGSARGGDWLQINRSATDLTAAILGVESP